MPYDRVKVSKGNAARPAIREHQRRRSITKFREIDLRTFAKVSPFSLTALQELLRFICGIGFNEPFFNTRHVHCRVEYLGAVFCRHGFTLIAIGWRLIRIDHEMFRRRARIDWYEAFSFQPARR
jgi:hypothetical protein